MESGDNQESVDGLSAAGCVFQNLLSLLQVDQRPLVVLAANIIDSVLVVHHDPLYEFFYMAPSVQSFEMSSSNCMLLSATASWSCCRGGLWERSDSSSWEALAAEKFMVLALECKRYLYWKVRAESA